MRVILLEEQAHQVDYPHCPTFEFREVETGETEFSPTRIGDPHFVQCHRQLRQSYSTAYHGDADACW